MLIRDHQIAWENIEILGGEFNKLSLDIQESLFIKKNKPTLNRTNSIRSVYDYSLLIFRFHLTSFLVRLFCSVLFLLLSWWKLEGADIALQKLLYMKKKTFFNNFYNCLYYCNDNDNNNNINNDDNNNDKHNNRNTRYNSKCDTRSSTVLKVKVKIIGDRK